MITLYLKFIMESPSIPEVCSSLIGIEKLSADDMKTILGSHIDGMLHLSV